ncbi:MAG: hypothetical protein IJZ57_03915 [Clostridia bacterium]|nr:hypothetical protein [Clostridia bacterium]
MKCFKNILCIILAIVLVMSTTVVSFAESDCNCEYAPTIIIPGIGQSETFLADENGNYVTDDNGDIITGWPLYFDTDYAIKKLVIPLVLSLLLQCDMGLSSTTYETAKELVKWNSFNSEGKNNFNIQVRKFPQSVAECSEEDKEYIYDCIPIKDYADIAGEDHLYFFAYNSFGNNMSICAELYDFIQQVKEETGHEKVNIIPISLGGTIANGLLDYYPQVMDDLNRVVYIVPALNGSKIVSDLLSGNLSTEDEMLYDYMFPSLMDDKLMGNVINIALRILPKDVVLGFVEGLRTGLCEGLIKNCTTMWSLVPSEDYEECREIWLSGDENATVRSQTDRYYQAQCNSLANIQKMVDKGIEVFDIVDYGVPLFSLAGSFDECNADGIIQLDSTAMGVESCLCGEEYGADYQQKFINKIGTNNCTDPTHNHISPDREVDASTCLLPETTFFFYKQSHDGTGSNDVIMKLAIEMLTNSDFKDIYSDPGFPQFNIGREPDRITDSLLPEAKRIDTSALSEEDAALLNNAIERAEKVIADTVVIEGECEAVEKNLENVLIKLGYREEPEDETANTIGAIILERLNKMLNVTIGYKGFSDII